MIFCERVVTYPGIFMLGEVRYALQDRHQHGTALAAERGQKADKTIGSVDCLESEIGIFL